MDEEQLQIKKMLAWMRKMEKSSNPLTNKEISFVHAQQMICSKKLKEPLLYLANHLHPPDYSHEVRLHLQNAQLRMGIVNGSGSNSKQNSLKTILANSRATLETETQECLQLGEEEEKLRVRENELLLQIKLRHQSLYKTKVEIEQMKNWFNEVRSLTGKHPVSKDTTKKANSKKELLAVIDTLKQVRMELLMAEGNLINFHNKKLQLWNRLADIMKTNNPSLLYEAFSSISFDSFVAINKKSQNVDLAKDALDLSLHSPDPDIVAKDGNANPASNKRNLLQMDANHLRVRIHAHNLLSDVNLVTGALNVLKDKLTARTNGLYGEGAITEQICCLEKCQINLAGTKKALAKATEINRSMEKDLEFAKVTQQNLLQHYLSVQNFESDVKKNVLLTKGLVVSTSSAWHDLSLNQKSICDCVEKGLSGFRKLAFPSAVQCMNLFNVFAKMPLALINSEAVDENKRAFIHSPSPCNWHHCNDILGRGVLSLFSHWIYILETFRQNKRMKSHLRGLAYLGRKEYHKMLARCRDAQHTSSSHVKGLCEQAVKHDRHLEANIEPLLEKYQRIMTISQKELSSLKEVVDTWFGLLED